MVLDAGERRRRAGGGRAGGRLSAVEAVVWSVALGGAEQQRVVVPHVLPRACVALGIVGVAERHLHLEVQAHGPGGRKAALAWLGVGG
jgi:hypothetical protein